ncbi:hypothetical protein DF3PB_550012 [uncultured Defluviicoccus sp.]|uniref:NADP-dependent oxidoreductase domain-containing protein n=1 Tax=metagenome TaxID=256318 RepID=A0A380THS5_9ZZZZ|nr:hypothetical protein DF3PB_550012 [uncultured Defluviicoccus sp.]
MPAGLPLSLYALIRERGIFGCASLHHLPTIRQRLRLLEAAYGAGFRQFDVAPAYGNGVAERAVGTFAAEVGRDIKVHTKVGIPIRIYPAWTDGIFPVARAVDAAIGNHRRVYRKRRFSPDTLKQSLADSTVRLGGLVPDGYYLHEPLKAFSAAEWAEFAGEMDALRNNHGFGFWGIAGPQLATPLTPAGVQIPAIQCPVADWLAAAPADRARFQRVSLYNLVRYYRAAQREMRFEAWLFALASEFPQAHFVLTTLRQDRLVSWGEA